MATTVIMIHPETGKKKKTAVGFSWTMLFFGCLAPLFRGDFKAFILHIILMCTVVGWLVYPFLWNGQHYTALSMKGYITKKEYDEKQEFKQARNDMLNAVSASAVANSVK